MYIQVDWIKYQKRGLFFAHIMCGSLGTNDICTDYLIVEFVVSNDIMMFYGFAFCFTAHTYLPTYHQKTPVVPQTAEWRQPLPDPFCPSHGWTKFIYHYFPKVFSGKKVLSAITHRTIRVQHHHSTNQQVNLFEDFAIYLFVFLFVFLRLIRPSIGETAKKHFDFVVLRSFYMSIFLFDTLAKFIYYSKLFISGKIIGSYNQQSICHFRGFVRGKCWKLKWDTNWHHMSTSGQTAIDFLSNVNNSAK